MAMIAYEQQQDQATPPQEGGFNPNDGGFQP
jgi:hypothetical protein